VSLILPISDADAPSSEVSVPPSRSLPTSTTEMARVTARQSRVVLDFLVVRREVAG
jgi:hypothetical protein